MTDNATTTALAQFLAEALAPTIREAVEAATTAALERAAPPPPARLLDVQTVAERLRCSTETVRRRAKSGKLPAIAALGRLRFRVEDVEAFIARGAGGAK